MGPTYHIGRLYTSDAADDSQGVDGGELRRKAKLKVWLQDLAGIMAGITGIGGGVLLAPLFLTMDMMPIVVASTN